MPRNIEGIYHRFGGIYYLRLQIRDTSTLKREAVASSETSVNTSNITWHKNPEYEYLTSLP